MKPLGATAKPERERDVGAAIAGYALPFGLIVYLALMGGGYDQITRGEIGILAWWIVVVGALVGVLPRLEITRAGWLLIGLLLGLTAWTTLGAGWSESAERSIGEASRVATYSGVLTLSIATGGSGSLRRTVRGVAGGIAVVGILALLSRLHPSWFSPNETAAVLVTAQARLNYPLDYWNGLATLIAMGIPLLLAIGASSGRALIQVSAVAAVPALALAGFFTLSRGGALELTMSLLVLIALYPQRGRLLSALAAAGIGSAVLIFAANRRQALQDGLDNGLAASQGDGLLVITLLVTASVGLIVAGIARVRRSSFPFPGNLPSLNRKRGLAAMAALLVGAILAFAVFGDPADRWQEFKDPNISAGTGTERFESASGSGRYQYWQSALDASSTDRLLGIGPGTFEYWWAENGSIPGFVRDAHSLYLETLAEQGIIGLALILALVGTVILLSASRAWTSDSERGAMLAGACGSCVAFGVATSVDWAWEQAVLPVAFLLLAAAIVQSRGRTAPSHRASRQSRVVLALLAFPAIGLIAIPLAGARAVNESQEAASTGDLDSALSLAQQAASIQPYAASPSLQQALVLEELGELQGSIAAASEATRQEPTNWRTWLVLSRLHGRAGNAEAALRDYLHAKSLNPRSAIFQADQGATGN